MLEFLLARALAKADGPPPDASAEQTSPQSAAAGIEAQMALFTLRAMASGGIHDQVGGGFHRYVVDATWTVPHFEKMLYDNALLARAYLHGYRLIQKRRPTEAGRHAPQARIPVSASRPLAAAPPSWRR